MKKKRIALVLCVIMAASLVGCSSQLSNEYVTIKQYKGLEVSEVAKSEVTDDDVENTINSYLSASPLKKEITDRVAETGDTVDIDYKGTIDGEAFEGGTASGASLKLGSGSYIGGNGDYKGFEEQIVGHKTGDKFDIKVKFPDDYKSTDMAGKVADFNITLNGIYTVSDKTELTDEWVQQNSKKSETVEEFKKEIRENMEKSNENSQKSQLRNSVLAALDEQIEVKKYPDKDVDKEYQAVIDYYTSYAQQYGLELDEFLKNYMNMTEDDFKAKAKEVAQNAVRQKLACELIAKKKKLEPDDKEYEEKVKEYAERAGFSDVDAFRKAYDEDTIKSAIIQETVADYLVDKCVQVESTSTDSGSGADTGKDTGTDTGTDSTTSTDTGSGTTSSENTDSGK